MTEFRWSLLALLVFSLGVGQSASAANITVHSGESFNLENSNTTLTWANNQTFTDISQISTHNRTLQIGQKNISVYSISGGSVNATLYTYNLSEVSNSKELSKLSAETNGSETRYEFTGLPSIELGRYEVRNNTDLIKTQRNGGVLNWGHSISSSNYTVSYLNDTSAPETSLSLESDSITEGDSIRIRCSSSDVSGIKKSTLTVSKPGGSSVSPSCGSRFEDTDSTGEYTVEYTATDEAGNRETETVTFTVTTSSSGGGSSTETPPSSVRTWLVDGKQRFSMTPDGDVGIQNITVETNQPQSSFSISVKRLNERPSSTEEIEDSYAYFQIEVGSSDEEIKDSKIRFSVNRSFAEQYDRIHLSRYRNQGWVELTTQPVEQSGEEWTYEASATGFSYYAVTGSEASERTNETTEQQDTNQRQENNNQQKEQARNSIEQAQKQIQSGEPGYQLLQQARQQLDSGNYQQAQNLTQQALQENRSQKNEEFPWTLIVAILLSVIVAGLLGYLFRRKRRRNNLRRELFQIRTRLNTSELSKPDNIVQKLDEAEENLEEDNYRETEQKLREIKDQLE